MSSGGPSGPAPALSVVIPTHDTRELTLRCLETVDEAIPQAAGPSGRAIEVILVDDGSRDGTGDAVAERHPRVRLLRRPEAGGFTRAANDGLAEARGEILLLLNSDTEVPPDAFARLLSAFEAHPRLGVAGARLVYPDGSPQWSGGRAPTPLWMLALASGLPALLGRLPGYRRLRPVSGSEAAPDGGGPGPGLQPVDWVTGAALALRRAALAGPPKGIEPVRGASPGGAGDGAPVLDPRFVFYGQDLELCRRLGRAGWTVAILPELPVVHRHGATIGRREASGGLDFQPALLWSDLLRWVDLERGFEAARRAARLLALGTRLQLLGRALAGPFLPSRRRDGNRRARRALRTALEALRATLGELSPGA